MKAEKSDGFLFCKSALLPILITLAGAALDCCFTDLDRLKIMDKPYFVYFMLMVAGCFAMSFAASCFIPSYRKRYLPKVKFYCVMMAAVGVTNLIIAKTDWLPVIYFPSYDHILWTYTQHAAFLAECVTASSKLYIMGVIYGWIAGLVIGTAVGWSQRVSYWISPITRFIGPIPTGVWVPFAVYFLPSLGAASQFVVALSMAFPMIVLTSSGIQNVPKEYFEVGSILGAGTMYQIIHIAIPAALPQIFVGMFNGVTMSFMSLMIAELIGVQSGIGWYINWRQRVMSFADVYASLILLALMCFITMKVLFIFRKKFLSWQEGIIRW